MKNKHIIKTLSIFLVIAMLLTISPICAVANDNYSEVINNAGKEIQQQMISRNNEFKVSFDLPKTYNTTKVSTDLYESIFADDNKISLKAGDYLAFSYDQIEYRGEILESGNNYNYIFTISATYYDNYNQEQYIDLKTEEIINSLNLNNLSEYEKAAKINEWIYNNVKYDYNVVDYLPFTPYNALVSGKAVCQGFSTLTYLLATKAGLNTHIIRSDNHSWNVVEIDGKWYYWDTTYNNSAKNPNKYFLVCSKHSSGKIVNNSRKNLEFFNKHKLSDTCYINCNSNKKKNSSSTVKPNIKNLKIKKSKNKINISWKKNKNVTGYQVQYSTTKRFKKKNTKTITITKNKPSASFKRRKEKTYYVRVRAYKSSCKEHKKYAWSKIVKVKK